MFFEVPNTDKLFEVRNEMYGISANVVESPNPKYKYRLMFMDDDATEAVSIAFGDNYDRFVDRAIQYVRGQ